MLIKYQVVICSKILETYDYENYNYHEPGKNKSKKLTDEKPPERKNTLESRQISNIRSKKKLRRLINTNCENYFKANGKPYKPVFLTLTFRENITLPKVAYKKFTDFIKRLNYYIFKNKKNQLAYSQSIEFQKKGRVHYHVIFYNLPYVHKDKLAEIWANGFIKIKQIDKAYNVGAYVCKYMTKDLGDERLCGQKAYSSSKGLKKPIKLYGQEAEIVMKSLKDLKPVFEKPGENEYTGKYTQRFYRLP